MLIALVTLFLERQDLSCTNLAHHELENDFIAVVMTTTIVYMQWQEVPPCPSPWLHRNMM